MGGGEARQELLPGLRVELALRKLHLQLVVLPEVAHGCHPPEDRLGDLDATPKLGDGVGDEPPGGLLEARMVDIG